MIISQEKLLKMYELMLKIRLFEENALVLFNEGLIRGPVHLYIGEEAVAVGVCASLRPDDYITSTHRGHGHCIAKGGDIKKMAAELLGKATGYSKGKGGSMHIADIDLGILGANGIVGGGIGIAVGSALSSKLQDTGKVTICFFGDGASNQGIFHESLNLSAIWKLPVIFICENNLYGLTSPAEKMISVKDISVRAKSYNIHGKMVDGNDVITVFNTVKKAIERARKGAGPELIEAKTYRWEGHYVGDPCIYRTEKEVEEWKKKCPIKRLTDFLLSKKTIKPQILENIRAKVESEIQEAFNYARQSPEPELDELFKDVFTLG